MLDLTTNLEYIATSYTAKNNYVTKRDSSVTSVLNSITDGHFEVSVTIRVKLS